MNIVRRLLSSSSGGSVEGATGGIESEAGDQSMSSSSLEYSSPPVKTPEQELLGLNHLKKLHYEYTRQSMSQAPDKELKLYAMLPLFCNVFSSVAPKVISEKFKDEINAFTNAISRLLVTEVRRRASNQSTEAAAAAIATFMEVEVSGNGGHGWHLLSSLSLLVAEGDAQAEVMTAASLPSTLVKCLYLFFDLPPIADKSTEDEASDVVGGEAKQEEYSAKERRLLLQKLFIQVLMKLCTYQPAVEELARKDDLTLLFSAITSECPPHNVMWRKTSADILLTISRHSLSQPVISYLHGKGCISLCVENMQKSTDPVTPLEIVEMFVTVFCFLKDSSTSSASSETLLEDFRTCQGYIFLSEFLLNVDQKDEESREALRNLVLLVASLTFCGHTELKIQSTLASSASTLYQMDSFELPEPTNRGSTVRNLLAFQVLQTAFLKSQSEYLDTIVLDAVSTIYSADNANYFLSDSLNFLPQCAEKISFKSVKVQEKFFHLVEFLVHQLRHIPCKELIAISLILKAQSDQECCQLAVKSLISLIKFDAIFKNVLREIGMFEALIGCLSSTLATTALAEAVTHALTDLISGNQANANVFRDAGGVNIILQLSKEDSSRETAIRLMQQLILASGSEQDMTVLLELLQSSKDHKTRQAYVHALTICLRDSHRCRAIFRKAGGFNYLISVLLTMDQSLTFDSICDENQDHALEILQQLRLVFSCLSVAMRYEPANASFFQMEVVSGSSLRDAISMIGCFSTNTNHCKIQNHENNAKEADHLLLDLFKDIFQMSLSDLKETRSNVKINHSGLHPRLFYSCLVIRMLYDMAIDAYEKSSSMSTSTLVVPRSPRVSQSALEEAPQNASSMALNLSPPSPDPIIVHSSLVTIILQILPTLRCSSGDEENNLDEYSLALQAFVAELLQSLLRTEKNQQVMSDVDFLSHILSVAKVALENDGHPLHSPFQYLLERLSAQKLKASDLRIFLRLGNPLATLDPDEKPVCVNNTTRGGQFVPLTRIKTIVSTTTPRDIHQHNSSILPPFVEFDMGPEGFGCLFIPSLAPTTAHSVAASMVGVSSLASQESSVIGGIGLGDRGFPPQPGLSYSTWICVDKFSDPRTDPHPVRLLTIARTAKDSNNVEENYVCFSVALSARDKALIVSSNEVPLSKPCDWQPEYTIEHGSRIWFPDLIKEGEWHHIVLVLNRQVLKNSSFSLFVNGQHIATQKMQFISPAPGGMSNSSASAGGAGNLSASSVFAYIGTPPHWRRSSRLCWKQGPCLLFEDVASPSLAGLLYKLGPHYLGSLQAPQLAGSESEVLSSQVLEEKLILGLNAVAVSQLTLAKIKKIYSKVDNKAIAKQLGMTTGENATPIKILHNSAGHLLGPARSLGGVLIGYLGARVFNPQPVSKVMETVGGCQVLLGLIAMAHTMESLYAGVKALVCVTKSNPFSRMLMASNKGYQTLAMLLRKKSHLLNAHILHLMFTIAGTLDSGSGNRHYSGDFPSNAFVNVDIFRDVLCDLDLWHSAPCDLEKSLYEHFLELVNDSNSNRKVAHVRMLRDFSMVEKMLALLKKGECSTPTVTILMKVLYGLLCTNPRVSHVLSFALFTAATLEKDDQETKSKSVILRNRCLNLFHSLLYHEHDDGQVHVNYCEDMAQVVGFDWVLLFLQEKLHSTTVIWGLRILMTLVSVPSLMIKFRSGTCNGHWLIKSENVLNNKMAEALGQACSLTANSILPSAQSLGLTKIRNEIFQVPGFQQLNWLMPHHVNIPQVYFLLCGILLGRSVKDLPDPDHFEVKLDLDSIWHFLFGTKPREVSSEDCSKIPLNSDSIVTILVMVRTLLDQDHQNKNLGEYPATLTQFLFFLYHNLPDSRQAFMKPDVLTALVGTLFPFRQQLLTKDNDYNEEEVSTKTNLNTAARKTVMHFMRVIIVDSLSLPASASSQSKSNPPGLPVIDLLIDAKPTGTSPAQQAKFQTELLAILMDHLLAADVLIGDQAAVNVVPGGRKEYIAPNVFFMANRLVDKLWQGVFQRPPEEVFQFILKLIAQAKRRTGGSSLSLEGIYRSLNRSILYMLSSKSRQANDNLAGQMGVLDVLHKIVDNRSIIFGAGNHELEFFASLTFCLLRLTAGKNIPREAEGKTTWHVSSIDHYHPVDLVPGGEPANLQQGQNLLVNAATRVWNQMYVSKKPALEEVFKTSLGQQNSAPQLESIRVTVYETASKIWFGYIDQEKKGSFAKVSPWEFHTQLQSRLQRVTGGFAGGLRRLTSQSSPMSSSSMSSSAAAAAVNNVSTDYPNAQSDNIGKAQKQQSQDLQSFVELSTLSSDKVEEATAYHLTIVKDVVEQSHRSRHQTDQHMLFYVEEEWQRIEYMLTQERGIWGPYRESYLTKWMLDMSEGPCRMRKKVVRNDAFYFHYPYQLRKRAKEEKSNNTSNNAEEKQKYKKPTSHDSQLWFEQHQNLTLLRSNSGGLALHEEHKKIVEEYDDCDVSVVDDVNNPSQDSNINIDEEMRKMGFKSSMIIKTSGSGSMVEDESTEDSKSTVTENSSSTLVSSSPQQLAAGEEQEDGSSDYQTVMRLLEPGEKISHMYRCARIQGLDTTEGLLLFGKEHFYVLDGFTLVNGREVHDINFIPATYFEPIIPQVPGQTRPSSKRQVNKYAYEDVREVHKRRYLLQPIAIEVFCADGQNQLLAFIRECRAKVYQRFLALSSSIADSAQSSVAGQKLSASVETSGGLFSSLMGETSVTQRWVRGEISNFGYLMALNTLAGRSYNDLMQYPIFPWVLADYHSQEEPDLNDPASFRDLSKPMGAQSQQRMEQYKKRFQDWDDPHGDTPPYHYGTHYSSAMIVSSYLVRMEPFTQHFLHLQGGHFDLADRMFHSIQEAWNSSSKNNMADVRELIPEFFYLPDFLENRNHFDMGAKQSGEALNNVLLPPWAKGNAAEFIRINRASLESDYCSKHLHLWIDLIFGCKQQGPAAVEATNVFHHLFYEGNVDIFSIDDPLKRNATIGFINNFGQIPKQLFKKPHPAKRSISEENSAASSLSTTVSDTGSPSSIVSPTMSSDPGGQKLFFHNLTNLRPSVAPIKELKGPVGQIQHMDRMVYAVEQNKVLVPGGGGTTINRYLAWGYADQSFRLGNYESDKAVFICEPSYLIGQVLTCVCPNSKEVLTAGTSSVVIVYQYNKKVKQLLIKKMLYGHTDAVICLAASQAWSIAVSGSRDRSAIIWDLSRYVYIKHLPDHVGPVATAAINDLTGNIVTCAGSWLYVWDISGKPLASIDTNILCPPASPQPQQQQILCVTCSQINEWDRENVIMTGSSDGVVRMWSMDLVEVPIVNKEESKKPPSSSSSSEETHPHNEEGFVLLGKPVPSHVAPTDFFLEERQRHSSSDGYTWKRQLVFRAKLTMHTAFERPDNVEPAAVTAMAISKDHRTVYVGDERGRVFNWTVASKAGKGMVDHWWRDEGVGSCLECGIKFTLYERRHHCRSCGKVFCNSCSQYQAQIPRLKIMHPVRVCKPCKDRL